MTAKPQMSLMKVHLRAFFDSFKSRGLYKNGVSDRDLFSRLLVCAVYGKGLNFSEGQVVGSSRKDPFWFVRKGHIFSFKTKGSLFLHRRKEISLA